MSNYSDIQYVVDRPEPSKIYLLARNIAGAQLQKQFNHFKNEDGQSSYDQFKWIKAELTYPSFDNLTFAYKNAIFSVVIEVIDNNGTSFSMKQRNRLLKACNENNLIPCLFKIKLNEKPNSLIEHKGKNGVNEEYELIPISDDWNLFDPRTEAVINPPIIASEELTKMSNWELSNFAIQIVRDDITKEGNQVLSFCDLPEVNPQIWFEDKNGNTNWVVVKHITAESDLDYRKWDGLEKNNTQLQPYDGFFAAIQFYSTKRDSSDDLYRGDGMKIKYKGLERIYVS